MITTAWIYFIPFEFWLWQLHQHLHPHSSFRLNNKTYPPTPTIYQCGTGLYWQVHKGQRGREHTDWKSCFWSKCGAFSPKWEKLWPVLKGLQLLKEALARLQWVTYFSEDDHAVKCKDLLDSLELLKHEVAKKSQHSLLYRQTCQG